MWIERTYEPVLRTPSEALKLFPVWLLLDEIQYAPALLSAVKRFADAQPAPGAIWLPEHIPEARGGD